MFKGRSRSPDCPDGHQHSGHEAVKQLGSGRGLGPDTGHPRVGICLVRYGFLATLS